MAKKCRICGKSFPTDIALKRHVKESHRGYYYGVRLAPVIVAIVIMLAIILLAAFPRGMESAITLTETIVTPASPATQTYTTQAQTQQGRPAPNFELPEINEQGLTGRTVSLSQFAGRPVFLEFMSPTCPHCLNMAPIIKELEEKYGDRIVFISIVYPSGGIDYASKILGENELSWTHVVDENARVFVAYHVSGTPTYIILDESHVEVKRIIGENPRQVLEEAILSVLT